MRLFQLILNSLSLALVLFVNYLSNTDYFPFTVAEVSGKYNTFIVPAGYAFAIWSVIYLLLIVFVINQWSLWLKNKDTEVIDRTNFWLLIANLCNAAWVIAWVNEYLGLSVFIILMLLVSLIMLVFRLRLEIWDAPLRTIAFVWWPICIYTGWIIIATVADISAFLVSTGWRGGAISQQAWTVAILIISLLIYSLIIYRQNMREAALVGVWAYIAIAVRQWTYTSIAFTAVTAAVILLIYISWQAYVNRATSPFMKLKEREKLDPIVLYWKFGCAGDFTFKRVVVLSGKMRTIVSIIYFFNKQKPCLPNPITLLKNTSEF